MNAIENNMDFIAMFENRISAYTGFKRAICVDCCTNGILISLELLARKGIVDKKQLLELPYRTYMSVPMTLYNNGWHIKLVDDEWRGFYEVGDTGVYDSATDFHENMHDDYADGSIVCVSFQQKKRLALGRGGVILVDDNDLANMLIRMRHDGRDAYISDRQELKNRSDDIVLGYHCYMEPDKAAKGILLLNQPQCLPQYVKHSYLEYETLQSIQHLFK